MVRSMKAVDLWVCNKNRSTIHFYYLQPYKTSFHNIVTGKVNIFYTTSKTVNQNCLLLQDVFHFPFVW